MKLMEFNDGNRTFVCRAESSPATPGTLWWWITVTGESSRYAAFRAEPGDTENKLRPRILAYYAQVLADRARPRMVREHWKKPLQAANGSENSGPPAEVGETARTTPVE